MAESKTAPKKTYYLGTGRRKTSVARVRLSEGGGAIQINGRGLLNWGQILAWDIKYIRQRTVWLDLKIMLTTLKYVITRRGAF